MPPHKPPTLFPTLPSFGVFRPSLELFPNWRVHVCVPGVLFCAPLLVIPSLLWPPFYKVGSRLAYPPPLSSKIPVLWCSLLKLRYCNMPFFYASLNAALFFLFSFLYLYTPPPFFPGVRLRFSAFGRLSKPLTRPPLTFFGGAIFAPLPFRPLPWPALVLISPQHNLAWTLRPLSPTLTSWVSPHHSPFIFPVHPPPYSAC